MLIWSIIGEGANRYHKKPRLLWKMNIHTFNGDFKLKVKVNSEWIFSTKLRRPPVEVLSKGGPCGGIYLTRSHNLTPGIIPPSSLIPF